MFTTSLQWSAYVYNPEASNKFLNHSVRRKMQKQFLIIHISLKERVSTHFICFREPTRVTNPSKPTDLRITDIYYMSAGHAGECGTSISPWI